MLYPDNVRFFHPKDTPVKSIFLAHAWVVMDGQPVGESAEVAGYTVVHSADPKR